MEIEEVTECGKFGEFCQVHLWMTLKVKNFRVFANVGSGLLYIFSPTLPLYTQSKDLFITKANRDGMFHLLVYFQKHYVMLNVIEVVYFSCFSGIF